MKKIFSFLVAMLIASSAMFAGENLFNPATTTLETFFATGDGWAADSLSSATFDNTTGVVTVNIVEAKSVQWQAQVKLHTDLTALDPAKQYNVSFKLTSNVDFGGITAKMFDNAVMYEGSLAVVANTPLEVSKENVAGVASNGVIVFDFGYAPAGAVITIEEIVVEEAENHITSCAELYTLAKNDTITMGAFDVVRVDGSNIYIKDATGAGLVFKYNYGLKAGDHVEAGLVGVLDIYNGLYEVKPISAFADLTITAGEAPALHVATALPSAANMNEVVIYKNVTFAASDTLNGTNKRNATAKWNDQDLAIYNQFKHDFVYDANKAYNITAANAVYSKNGTDAWQVYFIEAEEFVDPYAPDTVDHGLYDPTKAAIDHTYFATHGWAADNQSSAELVNGRLSVHMVLGKSDRWQSQVFLNPGFEWTMGKYYRMEFDLLSSTQLGGVDVKINDSDEKVWYHSYPNDNVFLAEQDIHYVADSIAVDALADGHGLIVFGFGWVAEGTEIFIHNIRIVEIGDYVPAETHMYIKHPWGTGADADWSWQEMTAGEYSVYDAWVYEGKWGGVGCNIADNAEGANADWYPADKIQYLSDEDLVLAAPALGTDVKFIYIPALKGSEIVSPVKVIYTPTALDIINSDVNVQKALIDGQVVIIRNGEQYNMLGTQL